MLVLVGVDVLRLSKQSSKGVANFVNF